jgi:hypothetical protein
MYVEKIPDNHFGPITKEVIDNLLKGQSIGVYGIPGYGQSLFAKQVAYLLEKRTTKPPYIIKLNLELESDKITVLKKKICSILKQKDFDEIQLSEFLYKNRLIVILNEVNSPKYRKLFKFLNSIRWDNKENFAVLTVANYSIYTNQNEYLVSGKDIFFKIRKVPSFDLAGIRRIVKINNK